MPDEQTQKTETETSENAGEIAVLSCEVPGDVSLAKGRATLKEKT